MDTQAMETIKTLEIKSAPEKQTLEAANESYTKKQLAHFIERHDLAIAKSWLKDDIVSALSEWMNDAQKDLLSNDSDLLAYYEKMLASDDKLNLYEDDLSDADQDKLLSLMEHGLLYNVDGTVWIPAEAAETTEDVEGEEKTVSEEKTEQPSKKTPSNNQSKAKQATASLSTEERLAQEKQARLKYLKKQAKKKKGKKRK
ncbi:hypothetical protein [Alkalibacterium gilvum]|uniref:hypothetical protein n=1 Tax=Alkalibacterium gilvum TaxID=1130080 RepID=UPI00264E5466|nr:hypothetical protein [Alkalibacterium sp.]